MINIPTCYFRYYLLKVNFDYNELNTSRKVLELKSVKNELC